MLRNTMTNNHLTLFCLVDGETTSNAFKIKNIPSSNDVDDLRKAIKDEKAIDFSDIDADKLTLWRVSIHIPEDDDDEIPILLNNIVTKDKKKLGPATRLSKVFPTELPDETIHIIVQRPPPGNVALLVSMTAPHSFAQLTLTPTLHCSDIVQTPLAVPVPVRARSSTPFSDESRPGTPLSGKCKRNRLMLLTFFSNWMASL